MSKKYTTNFLEDTNGSTGSANQVLVSTAAGIDWVDGSGSGIIGGPYLPLTGGTMTGSIAMSNQNITGVNQITINDPGEGIVFTGTATMYLNAVDDATDSILKLTNATQLNLNSTARITSLVNPTGAQDAATKNYVDTEIGNIPSGLAFEGNWNASTDTPTLSGTTQDNGKFWIVSVAGSTNLSGITDWQIGDWAIYVDNGAGTDAWQKVDNSSTLSGLGAAGKVAFWSTTANVSYNNNFSYDGTNLTVPRIRVGDGTDGYFYSDLAGRTAFNGGEFYIQSGVSNYYNYATNQFHGNTSGDNHYFRGNPLSGNGWNITGAGAGTFAQTVTATGGFLVPFAAATKKPMINLVGATNYGLWHTEASDDIFSFDFNGVSKHQFFQTGNATFAGDLTISGGDIVLGGTGRIQGVDTVSASTDAANKAYVDAHGGGLGPFLPLAGGTMANTNLVTNMNADLLDGKDHTNFGATLATYGTTASASGRIRCTAPFNTNSGHMFQITVSVYSSYTVDNYVVSGYMYSSTNNWYSPKVVYSGTGSPDIKVGRDSNGKAYISIANGAYTGVRVHNMTQGYYTSVADTYDPWTITIDAALPNVISPSIYTTWTSGNDGAGSGLDADKLDGQQGSYYLDYTNFTGTPTIPSVGNGQIDGRTSGLGLSGSMDATANQSGNTTFTVTSNAVTTATASTIAYRDSSADLNVRLLRANYNDQSTISGAMAFRVNNSSDNYTRYCNSPSAIRTFLGVPASGDLGSYLPLAGGTMSGNIAMGNYNVTGITDAYIADQIIHTGDTDTYLQFHAANQFRIVTGGTEMLEVNDTNVIVASNAILEGKVYINATASIPTRSEEFQVTGGQIITNTGTDGPTLDLGYNSSGSVRIQLGRGRTADGLAYMDFNGEVMPAGSFGFRIIRNSGANAVTMLNQVGTGNLQINASNGADTVFTNTNVGIGVTSPTNQLHVHTDVDNDYAIRIEGSTSNTSGDWTGLGIGGETNNTKSAILFESIGSSYSRGKLHLCVNNESNQNSATPADARLTISADRVGIGVTAPEAHLHVEDTTTYMATAPDVFRVSQRSPEITFQDLSSYIAVDIKYQGSTGSTLATHTVQNNPGGAFYKTTFDTGGSGGSEMKQMQNSFHWTVDNSQKLTLSQLGYLGINDTTPGYSLDVNGGGRFTGTVIATNFILSSDERLKENIEKVCDNIIKVDWKTFELKANKGQKRYGVIAQELEKTNPEFVREDVDGFKSVAYIDLLIAKIAELEARLEKLEK